MGNQCCQTEDAIDLKTSIVRAPGAFEQTFGPPITQSFKKKLEREKLTPQEQEQRGHEANISEPVVITCNDVLMYVETVTEEVWSSDACIHAEPPVQPNGVLLMDDDGGILNNVLASRLLETEFLDHPKMQAAGFSQTAPPVAFRTLLEEPEGRCTKEMFRNKFRLEVKLVEMFMCGDTDNNGLLSCQEFHRTWSRFPELSVIIRRVIGTEFPTFDSDHLDIADFIFKKLDKDGENMISRDDLMQLVQTQRKVGQIFERCDKNHDGIVSLAELERVMVEDDEVKAYFESVVADDFAMAAYDPEVMFKFLDENSNGEVSFTEFIYGIRGFTKMA